MRTAIAISLVLLGGGATAMAVNNTKRCQDPATGEPIACSNSYGRSGSSYWFFHSYTSSTGKSISGTHSSSAVARSGFGSSGSAHHAGS